MSFGVRNKDSVVVLAGKGRGKRGKVMRLSNDGRRAFVEGVNMMQRRVRRTRQNPQGGTVEQETSIHISNLALFCDKCQKGTRFRKRLLEDGTKVRSCSKCGNDQNVLT